LLIFADKQYRMGDVALLLQAARRGETAAVGRVLELLHPELKRLAPAHLRDCKDRLLMDASALVDEAYRRLLSAQRLAAVDRGRFLAYAAQVMRGVVVDIVHEQQAGRRAGGCPPLFTLNTLAMGAAVQQGEAEILAMHEALDDLAQIDTSLVRVAEMRYFVGLDNHAVANCLGLPVPTAERDWEKARTFLQHMLTQH
jgi:RNA polymerase sigma factor (TIGR02999 family)